MGYHLGYNVFHDVGFAVVNSKGSPKVIYEETKFTGRKEEYLYPFQSLEQLKRDGFTEFDSLTGPKEFDMGYVEGFNFGSLGSSSLKDFTQALRTSFNFKESHFIYHHEAHAESSFFASGFDNAHVLVIDGAGEEQSVSLFYGESNTKGSLKEYFRLPRAKFSYGHLYGFITSYLGYNKGASNTHCGKIMGLSSYGSPLYLEELKNIFNQPNQLFPNNHFACIDYLGEKFGPAFSLKNGFTKEQADIAASIQAFLEEDLIRLLKEMRDYYPEIPKSDNLCLAGGVAMNSVANGKILFSDLYKDIFVQPASTDAGLAYGAAHYGARQSGRVERNSSKWNRANFGYECTSDINEIINLKDMYNFPIEVKKLNNPANYISETLDKNQIVAVCRGNQEVGERALGLRSILSLPSVEMRDKVNSNIKYRENWRPFAPIIHSDFMNKIFSTSRQEPFMTIVYPVKDNYPQDISGIVHVDSTARLQTANKSTDEFLSQILEDLETKFSRSPVILNTSFNINGQSMVRTSYDAIVTFLATAIDQLVINDVLIKKKDINYVASPSSIAPIDRILQPYIYDTDKVCIIYISSEDDNGNLLKTCLGSTCIKNKYSIDQYSIKIHSNYKSDKQKWFHEAITRESIDRKITINNASEFNISNDTKNILLVNSQLIPMKIGQLMSSFKKQININDNDELISIIEKLSENDIIVDIQKRPFTKHDFTNLSL